VWWWSEGEKRSFKEYGDRLRAGAGALSGVPARFDSDYSVYDPTGRLLYERPLPAGATLEEIDLSRFGRGVYLLRVSDTEGVRHVPTHIGRVVVE
jgi:hypothetical protein